MESIIKEELTSDDECMASIPKIETIEFEDNTKCGEVLVGPTSQFTFVCILCQNRYADLFEFGWHIRDIHFQLNNKVDWRETEASDPLFNSTDVKPTPVKVRSTRKSQKVTQQEPQEELVLKKEVSEDSWPLDENIEKPVDGIAKSLEAEISPHIANVEGGMLKYPFWCKICDRDLKKLPQFEAHIRNMHTKEPEKSSTDNKSEEPAEVKLICKYCDRSFHSIESFNEHGDIHLGRKKFTCAYCSKTFSCRSVRQSHVNSHTGERPFQCPHCPKAFANSSNLQNHINIHLNIKRFSCDFCGKTFVTSTEKIGHERIHTGEKPYQCEECGRRFISHIKLTEHKRRHMNIRNYICEVCNKAFYCMNQLKDHKLSHTNERPFVCNVCQQTFSRRKALRAHAQLHADVKQYVCDTCGKRFAQCAGLYSHKKSHGVIPT